MSCHRHFRVVNHPIMIVVGGWCQSVHVPTICFERLFFGKEGPWLSQMQKAELEAHVAERRQRAERFEGRVAAATALIDTANEMQANVATQTAMWAVEKARRYSELPE